MEAGSGNVLGRINQLPQHRTLVHRFGIGANIGRRRRGLCQLGQIGMAASGLKLPGGQQPVSDGNDVNRLPQINQFGDLAKDGAVLGAIEIFGCNEFCDGVPAIGRQQQAAYDRPLGLDGLGLHTNALQIRVGHR